jgi:hypothetical protein
VPPDPDWLGRELGAEVASALTRQHAAAHTAMAATADAYVYEILVQRLNGTVPSWTLWVDVCACYSLSVFFVHVCA